jgi:hypothetical protein
MLHMTDIAIDAPVYTTADALGDIPEADKTGDQLGGMDPL